MVIHCDKCGKRVTHDNIQHFMYLDDEPVEVCRPCYAIYDRLVEDATKKIKDEFFKDVKNESTKGVCG